MFQPLNIGGIRLDAPLLLAPMAGVTDHPFRVLCRRYGAALVYSEFISAEGIIRETAKTLDKVRFAPDERPIGIQVFGHDPQTMHDAVQKLTAEFAPDLIDINYGCPVPKVTKKHAGSGALRDLCLMDELTAAAVAGAGATPVTVKMRAGWSDDRIVIPEAGERLQRHGIAAITLHPRTTLDQYRNHARWELIAALKQAVRVPVIANGDVTDAAAMRRVVAQTNCDGVMIGRAALGNPWIFAELRTALAGTPAPAPPSAAARVAMAREHLELLIADKGEFTAVLLMRRHISWYLQRQRYLTPLRQAMMRTMDLEAIGAILDEMAALAAAADTERNGDAAPPARAASQAA